MSFSTRSNPRLAQSGVALTSLGAVGGARGTAAGGLRILVEFLSTYDRSAISEVEGDLAKLEQAQQVSEAAEKKRLHRLSVAQKSLNEVRIVEGKLTREQRHTLHEIERLESSRAKGNKARAAELTAQLKRELSGSAKSQGLLRGDIDLLFRKLELERQIATLQRRQETQAAGQVQRQRQINALQQQRSALEFGRASIGARLGGLAIGAVGGIVGGAVLGVGFQLAEAAIEKVGDAIQDLIDPSRHAREAVKELAQEVNNIASQQNITQLQAARQFISQLGFGSESRGAGGDLAKLLEQQAVQQQVNDLLTKYLQLVDIKQNQEELNRKQAEANINTFRKEAQALGIYNNEIQIVGFDLLGNAITKSNEFAGALTLQEYALERVTDITNELADAQYRQAQAAEAAALASQRAAALASIAAEQAANAIQAAGSLQLGGIDRRIEALGTGESARTRQLQARLERAQDRGGGGGNSSALRNIAEERALILLRQRLRLLGTAINLEKYSGKFLLEAINAKIAALQKEGDAQQRVNRLLDLQFRMSQTIQRQEGESIKDFLERRAQENRKLLQERDDIEREAQIARLEARRQEVEDEVALAELAQRKKEALQSAGNAAYIKGLQKQLEASKKADEKALKDKRTALEKQRDLLERALSEATRLTADAEVDKTRLAIAGANSVQAIDTLAGRLAGYRRARATIQALVQGFGLPPEVARPLLAKINGLITAYDQQYDRIISSSINRGNQASRPFAKGGIIPLTNATSPGIFGSNVRYGEEGSEIGVVLSNKVAQILKQGQGMGSGQVGPFIIQKSDDWVKDRYAFGKLVQESVEAALG